MSEVVNQAGAERRSWPRVPASSLGAFTAAIVTGPEAQVVNLSRSGAHLEVAAHFPMRSTVHVKFMLPGGEKIVAPGRVVWSKVASIDSGKIRYALGVGFDQLLPELTADLARPQEQPAATESQPAETAAECDLTPVLGELSAAEVSRGSEAVAATSSARDREWDAERRGWEEERSMLAQQVDDAIAAADALQARLEAEAREYGRRLGEQQQKYEAMLAELANSANDRQTKYQSLVEQLSANRDEERRRADQNVAEAARWRAIAQKLQEEGDAQRKELKSRLDSAMAMCAAYDSRYTALRRHSEKLLSMLSAPPEPEHAWLLDDATGGTGERRLQAVS